MQLKLVGGTTRARPLNPDTHASVWRNMRVVCVRDHVIVCVCRCLLFTVLLVAPALEKTEALKTLCFGERQNSAVS